MSIGHKEISLQLPTDYADSELKKKIAKKQNTHIDVIDHDLLEKITKKAGVKL